MKRTAIQTMAVTLLAIVGGLAAPGFALADAPLHDDTFRLSLPAGYGNFVKQVQTVPSPEGEIKATNWVSKSNDGTAIVVTMSQMPGKILDPEKLISSTQDSLIKSLGATLESSEKREGTLLSHRLYFHSNAAFFRSRLSVQDDRVYQLLYVGRTAEGRSSPSIAQAFASFEIQTPAVDAAGSQH